MNKGTLKWTEIIVREVELQDVAKVVTELLDKYETAVKVEPDIDGTYSVWCKILVEEWRPINE